MTREKFIQKFLIKRLTDSSDVSDYSPIVTKFRLIANRRRLRETVQRDCCYLRFSFTPILKHQCSIMLPSRSGIKARERRQGRYLPDIQLIHPNEDAGLSFLNSNLLLLCLLSCYSSLFLCKLDVLGHGILAASAFQRIPTIPLFPCFEYEPPRLS